MVYKKWIKLFIPFQNPQFPCNKKARQIWRAFLLYKLHYLAVLVAALGTILPLSAAEPDVLAPEAGRWVRWAGAACSAGALACLVAGAVAEALVTGAEGVAAGAGLTPVLAGAVVF